MASGLRTKNAIEGPSSGGDVPGVIYVRQHLLIITGRKLVERDNRRADAAEILLSSVNTSKSNMMRHVPQVGACGRRKTGTHRCAMLATIAGCNGYRLGEVCNVLWQAFVHLRVPHSSRAGARPLQFVAMVVLCPYCSGPMPRAYPVCPNASTINLCLDCGLNQNDVTSESYELLHKGRSILLSGEQLLNPKWYITQLMSTSSCTLDQMRLLEEKLFGTAMARNSSTRGMGANIASRTVRSALSTDLLYAKPILQLGSYNIGEYACKPYTTYQCMKKIDSWEQGGVTCTWCSDTDKVLPLSSETTSILGNGLFRGSPSSSPARASGI